MNVGEMQRLLSVKAEWEPGHRFGDLFGLLYRDGPTEGKPDAVKVARPVWGGGSGNVPMTDAHAVRQPPPEATRPAPTLPFAWLGRYRRNSKDYERRTESSEAVIKISAIHQMLRRLRPDTSKEANPFNYPKITRKSA